MSEHEATAQAYPNLALIKYWGKADDDLVLPQAGSVSLTLDHFATTTTVRLTSNPADTMTLGGAPASDVQVGRVTRFLDLVRTLSGSDARATVTTQNEAPTGAGFASSASGFAALAVAASGAYGLDLSERELSRLARRGSGSAARSIIGGLAVWHAGDDESSFAESIAGPDIRMVTVTIDDTEKAVSSRDAMHETRRSSPFHAPWVVATADDVRAMLDASASGDFTAMGELAESNALRMHAVLLGARPVIRYLTWQSIRVFDAARELRAAGIEAYATADAGPNVAVITRPEDAVRVADALGDLGQTHIVGPGAGAHLVSGRA